MQALRRPGSCRGHPRGGSALRVGYMAEYQVEQLCRDAKVLQIYGGTDEIQITQIARDLLSS